MAENSQFHMELANGQSAANGTKSTTNGTRADMAGKAVNGAVNMSQQEPARACDLEEAIRDVSDAWETNSLVEDILDQLPAEADPEDPDIVTSSVALEYRRVFRDLGPEMFMERNFDSGVMPPRKLLSAFGLRVRDQYVNPDTDFYHPFMVYAMCRELCRRAKLISFNSVEDAVQLIHRSNNIIVLTGAGISTSLGIPDFRSAGGLYARLANKPGLENITDPQDVFDIEVFKDDPSIFYSVAKDILPSQDRFTPTHAFIKLLEDKGKLLTNYTQNIDNLEARAGIDPGKLIQCHGSFATATCQNKYCGYQCRGEKIFPTIRDGRIPRCSNCAPPERTTTNSKKRKVVQKTGSRKRKNAWSDDDSDGDYGGDGGTIRDDDRPSYGGIMKPDITFFKEPLPKQFAERLVNHDRALVDLAIVIGTSLKVEPVSKIPSYLPRHIPQIYISRDPLNHINFDIDLVGDCDVVVSELSRRLGWDLQHEMIPENQQIIVEKDPGNRSLHRFRDVTPKTENREVSVSSTSLPLGSLNLKTPGSTASLNSSAGSQQ